MDPFDKTPANGPPPDELWQKASSVFGDMIDLPTREWADYLEVTCKQSDVLRNQVLALLRAHAQADHFLETPALADRPENPTDAETRVFVNGQLLDGRFEVLRVLGVGGMGEVYEAYDSQLRQRVAIKTLRGAQVGNAEMLERFRSEVLRSREITHPSVARVYDLFTHAREDGSIIPFFTMQLLEGVTLSHWISSHGPLKPAEALPLVEQMAVALDAAHKVGIVHRDFKPGNVFISTARNDAIKATVTDFGIAAESETSNPASGPVSSTGGTMLAGTPAYMAPEQIAGETSTPASDTYALGLVVYEILTGRPVFDTQSPLACALRKLAPENPTLPIGDSRIPLLWSEAIQRCIRRNPAERFANPLDFIAAVSPREGVFSRRLLLARGLWVVVILVAIVTGAIAFLLGGRPTKTGTSASIAVLPFENLSGDPEMAYFSDGISEELTTAFTSYPKLNVSAQSAAFAYRHSPKPLAEISRDLGAEMLLTGSVRRSENRLRISAQLVRGATGRQVWSQIYERDIRQIFTVQGEITNDVAGLLGIAARDLRSQREPTTNMEAHDLYLRGRSFWNKRTREGVEKGLDFFERAAREDDNFGLAFTATADSYIVMADYGWMPPIVAAPKIRHALQRALALDPDAADTQATLGMAKNLIEWDQAGAERAFQRALALKPSLLTAHFWYANYLMRARRFDEALREAETARRLDPVSLPTLVFLGWVRYYRHEYPAAIEIGKQVVHKDPTNPNGLQMLALSYAVTGNKQDAMYYSDAAIHLTTDRAVALRYRGLMLSLLPDLAPEAQRVAAELEEASRDRQAGYLAIIYAGLKNREKMYYFADQAVRMRDTSLLMANIAPAMESFRQEDQFRQVLRQLGYLQ